MLNRVLGFIANGGPLAETTGDAGRIYTCHFSVSASGSGTGHIVPFMPRRLPQVDIHPFSFARPRPVISRASFWIAIFPLLVQTVGGFNTDGMVYVCRNQTFII